MMKKLVCLIGLVLLVGCFEANDESCIKKTFCKNVPLNRYQQHIGLLANLTNTSRDSAAIEFKERAIKTKRTCLEEMDDEEMIAILAGVLGILAIGMSYK